MIEVPSILLACEFSGVLREEFAARGWDAWSCDLLDTERPGQHYKGDVRDMLSQRWDAMIACPPCTDLAVSGARHFEAKRADGRQQRSIEFFMLFVEADIPAIGVENPVGIMSSIYRKPDQIIQPWQFGEDASKATCLWLKGLPPLIPTKIIEPRYACHCGCRFDLNLGKYGCPNCCGDNVAAKRVYGNQTPSGQSNLGPSPDRAKNRSRTYQGIAKAMAVQWTKHLIGHERILV